jgi:hypothetical protein
MKRLPAIGWLVALGVVVAGCHGTAGVSAANSPSPSPTLVPWVATVAAAQAVPIPPAPTSLYRQCRANQLRGRARGGGGAGGTFYQRIRLVNISNKPCTLSGGPAAVIGVHPDGQHVTLEKPVPSVAGDNLVGPGPANLLPGRAGWLTFASPDACDALLTGKHDDYAAFHIVLRGGRDVRVTLQRPDNLVCGLSSSGFGAPSHARQPTSQWAALTPVAHMPARLTPGSVVHYTVTLTNRSKHEVRLSPCPSYAEYLIPMQSLSKRVVDRYYLNCEASPQIAAGGSVTFAMQMRVPDAPGSTKYAWQIQVSSVDSGGETTIRPSS